MHLAFPAKYMTPKLYFLKRYAELLVICSAVVLGILPAAVARDMEQKAVSSPILKGPDLDLSIHHYSRVLTAEGVLRESRYMEKMMRRAGHVWISRVLPASSLVEHDEHASEGKATREHKSTVQPVAGKEGHKHKHFNHVVLPRHVMHDGQKVRLEFVNFRDRETVSIAPSEYENVNFDGSWSSAYFLMDPQSVVALPLSKRASPVPSAHWREQERNGLFQRVLWDDKKRIPLIVEAGDRAGTFFERVEVKPQTSISKALPWLSTKGFAQKEYADYFD